MNKICELYKKIKDRIQNLKLEENIIIIRVLEIKNILFFSILLTLVIFMLSKTTFIMDEFHFFFVDFRLFILNFLPIFIFALFIYFLSSRIYVSYLVTTFIFLLLSIVNRLKLINRDDPFVFSDIAIFKEAINMGERYDYSLSLNIWLMIIFFVFISIIAFFVYKKRNFTKITKIAASLSLIIISIFLYNSVYINDNLYNELGYKENINIWSHSQQYQTKGFVYAFIHSIKSNSQEKPENYSKSEAKEILNNYSYENIPENKKVNIIAIMLEAYNDFTKFNLEFENNPYEYLIELKNKSYYGELITDIFGGGTIKTERKFITGYNYQINYRKNIESYIRYFNEQGYNTEASHPGYGWFYNRRNSNFYLGFQNFYYLENRYNIFNKGILKDSDYFETIIKDYEENLGSPYFHYGVTYQNHGPYKTTVDYDKKYLKYKSSYDESTYNMVNNYFSGINSTNKEIKKMIETLESSDYPTIVILFGDHNPYLGVENIGYKMLGIDFDDPDYQGLKNYYSTFYLLWGNPAAKEMFNKDFKGNGNEISPEFLMTEIFDYLGYKGNEFLQLNRDLKSSVDVINPLAFKENGKYTMNLSDESLIKYNNYKIAEYYLINDNKIK